LVNLYEELYPGYLFTVLSFYGVIFIPYILFLFTLSFGGKEKYIRTGKLSIFFLLPGVVTYIILITNNWHKLFFSSVEIVRFTDYTGVIFNKGPVYMAHLIFSIILAGMVIAYLINLIWKYQEDQFDLYRRQIVLVFVGISGPTALIMIQIALFFPFNEYLDLSPAYLFVGAILIGKGLFKTKLLPILTLAREQVFNNLVEGFIIINCDNEVVDINTQALKLIGMEKKIITGKSLFEQLYEDNFTRAYRDYVKKIENEVNKAEMVNQGKKDFTIELLHPNQPEKEWLSVRVRSIKDPVKDQLIGHILFLEDITVKKESEILRNKSNQLRNVLIAMLSHDLKNSIHVIQGFADIAVIAKTDETKFRALERIKTKSREINRIIQSVINFIKISDTASSTSIEPVDITNSLKMVISRLDDSIKEKKIFLRVYNSPPEGEKKLTLANIALSSVFYNLIENAIKFSPSESEIEIFIEAKGRFWRIKITDKGDGIPDDHLEDIFQPFQRFGPSDIPGDGLGLTLAKEAVECFKGRIWAENKLVFSNCISEILVFSSF
ncbi:MAG: histidine kinase N-terminal 7TM domain-containing protein, partial [Candidatus Hodarchaeales archaeon]